MRPVHLLLLVVLAGSACKQLPKAISPGEWQSVTLNKGFAVPLLIYYPRVTSIPEGGYPVLIALHGWNLHASEWKDSGIAEIADRYGVLVVCPEMGKANYEREYFRETVMRWNPKPSGRWIVDDLWPHIEATLPISRDRRRHGLIGVSTGGRGALLVAGYQPSVFGFAGMISGDFDVSETPEDSLAAASYGPHEAFQKRWKKESAVSFMNAYADTRVYVGHGSDDIVAPISQALLFRDAFDAAAAAAPGKYLHVFHEQAGAGHGWDYWKTELRPGLAFFAEGF